MSNWTSNQCLFIIPRCPFVQYLYSVHRHLCSDLIFTVVSSEDGAGPGEAGAVGGAELAEENQVLREENNMLKLKRSMQSLPRYISMQSHL